MGLVSTKKNTMKRFCLFWGLFCIFFINIIAQPKSVNYKKENDYFLTVLTNPGFSLCDFKDVGLNESNTELLAESDYLNATGSNVHRLMMEVVGRDDYATREKIYRKIAASWQVFKEIQYRKEWVDVHYSPHNIWAKKIDPVIKHKLSIVPLKLEEY